MFRLLARMRRLRGTAFDLFGYTAERRMERELIGEFERTVDEVLSKLDAANIDLAVEIVGEFLEIRGYGPVKEEAAANARTRIASKLHLPRSAHCQSR